jgi:hypothetical protein
MYWERPPDGSTSLFRNPAQYGKFFEQIVEMKLESS